MSDSIRIRRSVCAIIGIANRILDAGLELSTSGLLRRREPLARLVLLGELIATGSRESVAALVDRLARFALLVSLWVRVGRGLVGEVVVRGQAVVADRKGLRAGGVCGESGDDGKREAVELSGVTAEVVRA